MLHYSNLIRGKRFKTVDQYFISVFVPTAPVNIVSVPSENAGKKIQVYRAGIYMEIDYTYDLQYVQFKYISNHDFLF